MALLSYAERGLGWMPALRSLDRHPHQQAIRDSTAKRKVVRAGRRAGKTVIAARTCVEKFRAGLRPLYAAPTTEQIDTWWYEVKLALQEPLDKGWLKKNETEHTIEREGTRNRIKGKTAWNADTLRGDFADFLVLDEFQMMNEDAWDRVGAPMLLDNDGDAMFIYTPTSLRSKGLSKAKDPRHAARLFRRAQGDTTGRWAAFHFSSLANPHISEMALAEITQDISQAAYRQEILAEDEFEVPGALWKMALLDATRAETALNFSRIVVGVDPPGGATECGIIVAGLAQGQFYIFGDLSLKATPDVWGGAVIQAFTEHKADCIVGEANYGGDMVEAVITQAARARGAAIRYKSVQATRGKAIRAEPIVSLFEQGRAHIVGSLSYLEAEMCEWVPGDKNSPNRLDAMVWALTELSNGASGPIVGAAKASQWGQQPSGSRWRD